MPTLNAIVVDLTLRAFRNERTDAQMTEELRQTHQLGKNAARVVKTKLPPAFLAKVTSHYGYVTRAHESVSIPWEHGKRLLNLSAKEKHDKVLADGREKLTEILADMEAGYADAINEARSIHNGTFREEDYPPVEQFKAQFAIECSYEPVPESAHFGQLSAMFGDQLEQLNQHRIQAAIRDTWQRVLGPVLHLAEKLVGDKPIFRDSLVENVREIRTLLPDLNITNDSDLSQAASELDNVLNGVTPDLLRDAPVLRLQTAQAATEFVQRFGQLGNRKFG